MSKKGGVSSKTHTRQQLNDYANQHNPNNKAYKANKENRIDNRSRSRAEKFDIGEIAGESYGWCDD